MQGSGAQRSLIQAESGTGIIVRYDLPTHSFLPLHPTISLPPINQPVNLLQLYPSPKQTIWAETPAVDRTFHSVLNLSLRIPNEVCKYYHKDINPNTTTPSIEKEIDEAMDNAKGGVVEAV